METFYVGKDFERPEHAGAGGMFQINGLERVDQNGDEKDVFDKINPGDFFDSDDDLKEYLRGTFNINNTTEIIIEEL